MTNIEDVFFNLTETQKKFIQEQYNIFKKNIETDLRL